MIHATMPMYVIESCIHNYDPEDHLKNAFCYQMSLDILKREVLHL
jgi:hypothetical protein